jgi:hypothetical protein
MKPKEKIEFIQLALENADQLVSSLPAEQYQVPALTSLRIRHLLNSLGKLGTRYLEVGVHRGGTFTASVGGNVNLETATAIDSFVSDVTANEGAKDDFLHWSSKFLPGSTKFNLIHSDSFNPEVLKEIPSDIDLYLYDGDHSEESQKRALTFYKPVLADEFVFICDDFDWDEVQKGTAAGIEEAGYEILFEKYLKSKGSHDNDSWWNGFYVAYLKKTEKKKKIKKAHEKL